MKFSGVLPPQSQYGHVPAKHWENGALGIRIGIRIGDRIGDRIGIRIGIRWGSYWGDRIGVIVLG